MAANTHNQHTIGTQTPLKLNSRFMTNSRLASPSSQPMPPTILPFTTGRRVEGEADTEGLEEKGRGAATHVAFLDRALPPEPFCELADCKYSRPVEAAYRLEAIPAPPHVAKALQLEPAHRFFQIDRTYTAARPPRPLPPSYDGTFS